MDGALDAGRFVTALAGGLAAIAVCVALVRTAPRPPRVEQVRSRRAERRTVGSGHVVRGRRRAAMRVVIHRCLPLVFAAGAGGPFAVALVALAMMLLPRVASLRRQRLAAHHAALAYPDFVDLLVLTIKSGSTPRHALDRVADVVSPAAAPALLRVVQRAATGQRFAEAVDALGDTPPAGLGPAARPLIDALALSDRYGTPLTPILDRLADEARAQRRRNADAAARRLPVQLSFPLVVCTLPSFVLLTIVPLMAGTFSSLPSFS